MRRDIARGGLWLAGTALTVAFGYAATTAPQASDAPRWPYYLFSALCLVGLLVYIFLHSADYGSDRTEKDKNPTAVQVDQSHPELSQRESRQHVPLNQSQSQPQSLPETSRSPWDRNKSPRGHIKSFRFRRMVESREVVRGKVSYATRDSEPLLLVHSIVHGGFYPTKPQLDGKGRFKEEVFFGIDGGEESILLLVFLPKSEYSNYGRRSFLQDAKDELPEYVRVLAQRRVVRK
jgi:hypothetical protein